MSPLGKAHDPLARRVWGTLRATEARHAVHTLCLRGRQGSRVSPAPPSEIQNLTGCSAELLREEETSEIQILTGCSAALSREEFSYRQETSAACKILNS